MIENLEDERAELDTRLNMLDTPQNKHRDEFNAHQLEMLSKTEKEFQAMVKEEKDQIKELDREVSVNPNMFSEYQHFKNTVSFLKKFCYHIFLEKSFGIFEKIWFKAILSSSS